MNTKRFLALLSALLFVLTRSFAGESEGVAAEVKKIQERWTREAWDLTKGEKDTCPVHKVKMDVKEVPIRYGFMAQFPPADLQEARFPFGDDFVGGGCVETPDSVKAAKIFVCPQCLAARTKWMADFLKLVENSKATGQPLRAADLDKLFSK